MKSPERVYTEFGTESQHQSRKRGSIEEKTASKP